MKRKRSVLGLVFAVAATMPTHARDSDYGIVYKAGANYSDNVNRVASGELGSEAILAGAELSAYRPSGRVRYSAVGDIAYYEYGDKSTPGQLLGSVFAEGSYDVVPDVLRWTSGGSFRQARENLLLPESPQNRGNRLNLTTSPDVHLRIGQTGQFRIAGRAALERFGDSAFDSHTLGWRLIAGRNLTESLFLGFVGSRAETIYEKLIDPLNRFDTSETAVRLESSGARTRMVAEFGRARAETAGVTDSNPLYRFDVSRTFSPRLAMRLLFSQEYPTSEGTIGLRGASLGSPTDDVLLAPGPRRTRTGSFGTTFRRARTTLEVLATFADETAVVGAQSSRTVRSFAARASRRFGPRLEAAASYGYEYEDLSAQFSAVARARTLGADLSYRVGDRLAFVATIGDRTRTSTFALGNYEELTATLSVKYGKQVPVDIVPSFESGRPR